MNKLEQAAYAEWDDGVVRPAVELIEKKVKREVQMSDAENAATCENHPHDEPEEPDYEIWHAIQDDDNWEMYRSALEDKATFDIENAEYCCAVCSGVWGTYYCHACRLLCCKCRMIGANEYCENCFVRAQQAAAPINDPLGSNVAAFEEIHGPGWGRNCHVFGDNELIARAHALGHPYFGGFVKYLSGATNLKAELIRSDKNMARVSGMWSPEVISYSIEKINDVDYLPGHGWEQKLMLTAMEYHAVEREILRRDATFDEDIHLANDNSLIEINNYFDRINAELAEFDKEIDAIIEAEELAKIMDQETERKNNIECARPKLSPPLKRSAACK